MTHFWVEFFAALTVGAALLVVATSIVQRFTGLAAWRRTLWQACFVGLFALLLCEVSGARWVAEALFAHRPIPVSRPSISTVPQAMPTVESSRAPLHAPPIANPKSKIENQNTPWPGIIWLGGATFFVLLGIGRRVLLFFFCRRCVAVTDTITLSQIDVLSRQLGIRRRVRVIASNRLISPIAFGAWRPTICLPANFTETLSPAEREAVLLHELAHVAAGDSLWQGATDVVTALFWWHPLAWWAQRELRNATEAAADEASALLANGPRVLAECLVNLGTRFTDSAGFKALGVHGVRFRSNLGRRVQRLFKLTGARWAPPAVWRSRLTRFCAPVICVAALVICGALATTSVRANSTKGDTMKSWKQSLAGVAALSLLQSLQADPAHPEPKLDKAATIAAAKPARAAESAKPALPNLSELSAKSRGAQIVRKRLESIVLDQVAYDGLPLGEVVKTLIDESTRRDPEKQGVNFIFGKPRFHPMVDPATGLPVKGAQEPFDIRDTTIRISPPIRNVRLIDLLEVIQRVADRPIEYAVHEYGVVISEAALPGAPVYPESIVPTIARTFKVDPPLFFGGVQTTFGVEINTRTADSTRMGLAQFLATVGVDIHASNRAVFFNQGTGMMLVRASEEEMLLIDAAMSTLGATKAQ